MIAIRKHVLWLMLIPGLAGCNTTGGNFAERMTTDPGKYELYTCGDLRFEFSVQKRRELELKQLMIKASRGPGGELVNLIAYRTEFVQARGYQKLVREKQKAKNCGKTSIRNRAWR